MLFFSIVAKTAKYLLRSRLLNAGWTATAPGPVKHDSTPEKQEIAKRLRAFRESSHLTQSQIADHLKMSRARWASYEEARAELPWQTYLGLYCDFRLNAWWLATGEVSPGPLRYFLQKIWLLQAEGLSGACFRPTERTS